MRKHSLNLMKLLAHLLACLISGALAVFLVYYTFLNISDEHVIALFCLLIFPVGPVFLACFYATRDFIKGLD